MGKRSLCALAVAGVATSLRQGRKTKDCYSVFDAKTLLRLDLASPAEVAKAVAKVEELGCTEMSGLHSKDMLAICEAGAVDVLRPLYGGNMTVMNDDAGEFYRSTSGVAQGFTDGPGVQSAEFYSTWRSYATRLAKVESLVASCGGAAKLEQIGQSVEGRPIMAVRFTGAGWTPGSPRVILDFELHAREWIVGMAGVYAIEQTCLKLQAEPDWLANTEVVFAPAMNPDGSIFSETENRMWRKNRAVNRGSTCKGVDLNRNWNPDWSGSSSTSSSPCSDVFYGSAAFSEPETQALKNLLDEAPVSIQLDVHSYGNLILAPWSHKMEFHPQRSTIDVPGNLMVEAMRAVNGATYTYGGSEVLYPASGVCPDYITSQGGFGYTYELRPRNGWGSGGFAPGVEEILPGAQECWAGILAAITWSQNPYTTPAPPTPAPTPAPPPGFFAVYGSGCTVAGDCITSNNFPSEYGNNEECSIQVSGADISVESFNTERRYDILTVDGVEYSGTSGPASGTYSGTMTWSSDGSVTRPGWKLCVTNPL